MDNIPTICIKTSSLLEERFNISPMDEKRVAALREEWEKHEYAILTLLQQITGLSFAQNNIEVYIIDPDALGGMSDPMIIGGATGKKRFIFMLAHELTHRLMENNTARVDWHQTAWKLWPEEKHLAAHHVVVHAILEILFTRIENKAVLAVDKGIAQKGDAYARAWEIAEQEGCQNVIDRIKKSD